jgi:hypothetical protein
VAQLSREGDLQTAEQSALWEAYLLADGRAPREQKLAALGTFLDTLTPPEFRACVCGRSR